MPVPPSSCWVWLLSRGSHGYGQGYWAGKVDTAHRLSYRAFHGEIPNGALVQHSCDNKWCVNPDHLSAGTDATNALDKSLKGRAAKKYSVEQATTAKRLLLAGVPYKEITMRTGVSKATLTDMRRGRSWVNVGIPG